MRKVILAGTLIFLALVPGSALNGPSYNDPRLGERKDVSDKFTFARVMFGEMYPGMPLGDRGIAVVTRLPGGGAALFKDSCGAFEAARQPRHG